MVTLRLSHISLLCDGTVATASSVTGSGSIAVVGHRWAVQICSGSFDKVALVPAAEEHVVRKCQEFQC